jgi:hypothetical protein
MSGIFRVAWRGFLGRLGRLRTAGLGQKGVILLMTQDSVTQGQMRLSVGAGFSPIGRSEFGGRNR